MIVNFDLHLLEKKMGELIRFPVHKVQRSPGTSKSGQGSAEVLVFEGVQYAPLDKDDSKKTKPVAKT